MPDRARLHFGPCEVALPTIASGSCQAMITDPPSGTDFLGLDWDTDKGGRDKWILWLRDQMAEALRILPPGGHGLVWSLPRTSHWTGMALELAGWEPRDTIHHLFGTGFPKSLDVAKALDKRRGDDIEHMRWFLRNARDGAGLSNQDVDRFFGFKGMATHWIDHPTQPSLPTPEQWERLRELLGFGTTPELDAEHARLTARKGQLGEAWQAREVSGQHKSPPPGQQLQERLGAGASSLDARERKDKAKSAEAKRWEGYGTALKPAHEIWWLVRKPLGARTVTKCVREFGTGVLDLEACEVDGPRQDHWPPNLALTHSPDCEEGGACVEGCPVPEVKVARGSSGFPVFRWAPKPTKGEREFGAEEIAPKLHRRVNSGGLEHDPRWAPVERRNDHPTLKPVSLIRWFSRLICPPFVRDPVTGEEKRGRVFDPFMGSGTAGIAAVLEDLDFEGIDKSPRFFAIARDRIAEAIRTPEERAHRKARRLQGRGLFDSP